MKMNFEEIVNRNIHDGIIDVIGIAAETGIKETKILFAALYKLGYDIKKTNIHTTYNTSELVDIWSVLEREKYNLKRLPKK